jgi:molybdopterin-dependent oxidoreductase alpha subunit
MAKKSFKNSDIVVVDDVALTPEKDTPLQLGKPKSSAAGIPAVVSAIGHARKYMKADDAVKTMFKVNQKGGFDCPGCAWPDPDDDRSPLGEYCENGMKAIAEEASRKTIGADFFKKHSIRELGQRTDFELGKFGRLREPMYLPEGAEHYEPISWDQAFDLIAKKLKSLPSPDKAIFYTSGRTSNEAAYLYQLFIRAFGTNNLPDCSNMCHESSGMGLSQTLGIGKGSVTLSDLHEAEVILVMGQNPGTNHPRMLSALEKCKKNGGRIITVNPLPEAGLMKFIDPQSPKSVLTGGTTLTDLFLPVSLNQDIALLKAIMIRLLQLDEAGHMVLDHDFIKEYTLGYEALKQSLIAEDFEKCVAKTGLDAKEIEQAVQWIASSSKIIICWAMGLTQHENGVANIQEVVNLLLLKGSIGKPGAGACPVRGHSNVQGDRTMGIWEAPPEAFLDSLDRRYKMVSPREHGYAVVDAIHAMNEDPGHVFFAMGGNFISATPDTAYTAAGLRKCALTVQVSTKLNRSHLVHGKEALILPCLGRTDEDIQGGHTQFVSVENSMGVVHSSQGVLDPPSDQLMSEPAIISRLAQAVLDQKDEFKWQEWSENYDLIRDEIEAVIQGFDNFNNRVRQPGGFYLPNGARERKFNTKDGKAHFTVNEVPEIILGKDELMMMTVRSHDQYNTTIYGLDDRYRGIYNARRIIMMNAKDMMSRGLEQGDVVNLYSTYDGQQRYAPSFKVVRFDIPKGCTATYFPETNALVPADYYAKGSKTPCSKSIRITLEKVDYGGQGL